MFNSGPRCNLDLVVLGTPSMEDAAKLVFNCGVVGTSSPVPLYTVQAMVTEKSVAQITAKHTAG